MAQKKLFANKPKTSRGLYAGVLLLSIVALGVAYYLQTYQSLQPCPLCILQRFGFIWLGLWAFLGLMFGRLGRVGHLLAGLGGLAAVAVAGYHNWVLMNPSVSCVFDDPHQNFVNSLPTAHWLPSFFQASGSCSAELPPILGLSIPMWSLIGLTILTLVLLSRVFRR